MHGFPYCTEMLGMVHNIVLKNVIIIYMKFNVLVLYICDLPVLPGSPDLLDESSSLDTVDLTECPFTYPLSIPLTYQDGKGKLEPIPADFRREAGYTLVLQCSGFNQSTDTNMFIIKQIQNVSKSAWTPKY